MPLKNSLSRKDMHVGQDIRKDIRIKLARLKKKSEILEQNLRTWGLSAGAEKKA